MRNFNEYLSESKKHNFKVGDEVFSTKKYMDSNEVCDGSLSSYDAIVRHEKIIPGRKYEIVAIHPNYPNRLDVGVGYWIDYKCFEPFDEPEDNNFEQWNESVKNNLKIGDRVKIKYLPQLQGKSAIITNIKRVKGIFEEELSRPIIYLKLNGEDKDTKFCYLHDSSKYLTLIDPNEDTNYEEWVEESFTRHLRKGDRVICLNNSGIEDDVKLNKVYTLTKDEWLSSDNEPVITINSEKFGDYNTYAYRYKLVEEDELEDSNMEEWLEERYINKFKNWNKK